MTTHSDLSAPREDDFDSALLERYWLGESSPEDTAMLDAWFAEHPERAAWYSRLRRGITNDTWTDFPAKKVQLMVAETLEAIGATPTSTSSATPHASRWNSAPFTIFGSRIFGIGAALLLVAGLTWGTIRLYTANATAEYAYSTGVGQRITVVLADGSRVTLAPQTTVNVSPTFGTGTRTVSVEGEAHFDVISATGLPFLVQSGKVQTRVLGTRFVVKAYPTDRQVYVAVETGRVAVDDNTSTPTVLTAGSMASVNDSGVVISDSTKLPEYTDWVNGQLTFERSSLPDVLATLSRWYGVQFQIADSTLVGSHVSGTLAYGSLEDMFKTLKDMLSVSLTYTRNSNGSLLVTLHSLHTESQMRPRHNKNVLNLSTGVGR